MPDEPNDGTATQTAQEPPAEPKVKDPDAVLKKNEELLGKLKTANETAKTLADKIAEFEKADSERERKSLEKKGDYDKILAARDKADAEKEAAWTTKYDTLFSNSARYELAVALDGHDVLDGKSEQLAKLLLLEAIKPVNENGSVVWRKIDTDETVSLKDFIPAIKDVYDNFFKADNIPGSDAPGNTGKVNGPSGKWDKMSREERSKAIRDSGGDVEAAKKKHK